jgi:hypothetical protein
MDWRSFGDRARWLSRILDAWRRLRTRRRSFKLLHPLQPKHTIFQTRRQIVELLDMLTVGATLARQPDNEGPKNQDQKEFHKQCGNKCPTKLLGEEAKK